MNWRVLIILLLPFLGFSQVNPIAGNAGLQPSAYSRQLLTLPNQQQWQAMLGVNPNGTKLIAGTNITLQSGSGGTIINSIATNTTILTNLVTVQTSGTLTANFGPANFLNGSAGVYRVSTYISGTGSGSGTATLAISWTDEGGTTTSNFSCTLGAVAGTGADFVMRKTSAAATYTFTIPFGNPCKNIITTEQLQ
jgi:hypothetical protein